MRVLFVVFFFQAEDGIRDGRVTGVQTCALPISGSRLYATGDLGRWHQDGAIEFLGRIDGQVKLRGIRIELGEIEVALRGQPGISDAAAAVKEISAGDRRLV